LLLVSITVLACGPDAPMTGRSPAPSASPSHAIDRLVRIPGGVGPSCRRRRSEPRRHWCGPAPAPDLGRLHRLRRTERRCQRPRVRCGGTDVASDRSRTARVARADGFSVDRVRAPRLGGWSGRYGYEFAEAFLGDGAAYDPVTDSWWMPTEALLHTPQTSPPPSVSP
jgi:hypothetical protein